VNPYRFDRRGFLLASVATALGAVTAQGLGDEQPARLDTLTDWLKASPDTRRRGLQSCLERIRAMDSSIRAWVQVAPQPSTGSGTLAGIPYGVKDIVETRGVATEYGSPIYKGRIGTVDAAIIRQMHSHGAIMMGKTETTAFAYRTPPPTHNPRDLAHTPGGSSSGSAAAVAAGMVPLAIGEQTLGSVLRPASFCGVTGFKPTYGRLSMEGVLPLAKSLDTLGFFTHGPDDMMALWNALGYPTGQPEELELGSPEPMPEVDAAMAAAFENALSRLRKAGARIRPIDIAGMLAKLADAGQLVMFYEGARFHAARYREYGDRLGELAQLVRDGLQMPADRYEETLRFIASCKVQMRDLFATTPVILTPAAVGPAPLGLGFTGDARMNAPWTALGVPAISIPMPISSGLPLGLQVTAAAGEDDRVLQTAVSLQRLLSA
jgi:Asp-tRNA(Asn)/Glu-tRNA(Gln) amidotransferase A subunit family amidase